jgi:hypothetical protein
MITGAQRRTASCRAVQHAASKRRGFGACAFCDQEGLFAVSGVMLSHSGKSPRRVSRAGGVVLLWVFGCTSSPTQEPIGTGANPGAGEPMASATNRQLTPVDHQNPSGEPTAVPNGAKAPVISAGEPPAPDAGTGERSGHDTNTSQGTLAATSQTDTDPFASAEGAEEAGVGAASVSVDPLADAAAGDLGPRADASLAVSKWETLEGSSSQWMGLPRPLFWVGNDVAAGADGGFVVAGRSLPAQQLDLDSGDAFVASYAASGELRWVNSVVTDQTDDAQCVALDSRNDVFAGFDAFPASDAAQLIKYSPEGEQLWSQPLQDLDIGSPTALAVTPTDEVIVVGDGSVVAKFSADGELLWSTPVASANMGAVGYVSVGAQGELFLAGSVASDDAACSDGTALRLASMAGMSASGELLWSKRAGLAAEYYFVGIAIDSDGNPAALATSLDAGLTLVGFSASGEPTLTQPLNMPEHTEQAYDMALTSEGELAVVSGYSAPGVSWDGYLSLYSFGGEWLAGARLNGGAFVDLFKIAANAGSTFIIGLGSPDGARGFVARTSDSALLE